MHFMSFSLVLVSISYHSFSIKSSFSCTAKLKKDQFNPICIYALWEGSLWAYSIQSNVVFVPLFILKYECHTTSHSYFIIYNQMLLIIIIIIIIIITVTHHHRHHHHRCSSNKYRRWLIADWESESSFLLNA